ncbi:MAG: alpha/beta hydrolase-fold protein [Pseudomonadota bacterium]
MLKTIIGLFKFTLISISFAYTATANPQLATVEGARVNMDFQAPFIMSGADIPYEHEITVVLPASYHVSPDKTYPVLWVLDAPLMLRSVIGIQDTLVIGNMAPEMIIVGIGSKSEEGFAGVGRRVMDFSPAGPDYFPRGRRGDAWKELAPLPEFPHLADQFLSFLTTQLRPKLAEDYRFSGEHALFGHSAGGMFAAYSLFKQPGAFEKVIIGSPYLEGVRGAVFAAEQQYSAYHDDLDIDLFIGVGGRETEEYFLAASGIVSSTVDFAETLRLRLYPSLEIKTEIYSKENHYTVAARVISDGIRHLWSEETAGLGSSWPQPPEVNRQNETP